MFQIGEFSRLNKITVRTLRYYDEVDLLKPYFIDEESGYRYYDADQISILSSILLYTFTGAFGDIPEKKRKPHSHHIDLPAVFSFLHLIPHMWRSESIFSYLTVLYAKCCEFLICHIIEIRLYYS